MGNMLLLFISLVLFCLVARQLGRHILDKRHLLPYRTEYSSAALKLERGYKIMVYGILLIGIFASFVSAFLQVLSGQPF